MQHSNKPFAVLYDGQIINMTFDQMYKKYKRLVQAMIKKQLRGDDMLAEELTNDTFIKVLKSIDQYSTEFAISTWIFSIAKNLTIDQLRKKTVNTLSFEQVYSSSDDDGSFNDSKTDRLIQLNDRENNPEEKMIEQETASTMYANFDKLSERVKTVGNLFFFEGLSCAEVAEQLRMPLGTVKPIIRKARMAMMKDLPAEMKAKAFAV